MPRYEFGGTTADFVFSTQPVLGRRGVVTEPATLTFWSAATGGARYTDLRLGGSPVTSITTTSEGMIPRFEGPNDVAAMWADTGSGPRLLTQLAPGQAAVLAESSRAQAEAARAGAQSAQAGAQTARDEAMEYVATSSSIALGDAEAALVGQIPNPSSPIGGALSAAMGDQIATPGTPARDEVDDLLTRRREVTRALSRPYVANPRKHLPREVMLLSAATSGMAVGGGGTGAVDTTLKSPTGLDTYKVTATGSHTYMEAFKSFSGGFAMGPAQAIVAEVYLPSLTGIASLSIALHNDVGTTNAHRWVVSNLEILNGTLTVGWNTLRIPAARLIGSYTRANWLGSWGTPYRASVNVAGSWTTGGSFSLGRLYAEVQDTAKLMLINDGEYMTFFRDAYPDLKDRGYPLNLAPTFEASRWGGGVGTIHEALPFDEWLPYTRESGNSTSYHSADAGDGIAASSMTLAQLRAMNEYAQAELRKIEASGRIWRAAYTQNLAPAAPGTQDQMVAAAMYDPSKNTNGNFQSVPWPPIDPYNIRRDSPENQYASSGGVNARIDYWFAEMEKAHTTTALFIHAIDNAYQYSTSQAAWDYLIGKIDAAVAAGWLEVVTFEDLYYGSGGNFEIMPDGRAKSHWWTYPSVILD